MTREAKFDFANSKTDNRYSNLIKVYSEAWLSGMSRPAIAVALHHSTSNVKNVAYVSDKSGWATIRVKLYDNSTITLRTYEEPANKDLGYSWQTEITVKDGEVTVH